MVKDSLLTSRFRHNRRVEKHGSITVLEVVGANVFKRNWTAEDNSIPIGINIRRGDLDGRPWVGGYGHASMNRHLQATHSGRPSRSPLRNPEHKRRMTNLHLGWRIYVQDSKYTGFWRTIWRVFGLSGWLPGKSDIPVIIRL